MDFISKKGTSENNSVLFDDVDANYIVPVYAHEKVELTQRCQQPIQ